MNTRFSNPAPPLSARGACLVLLLLASGLWRPASAYAAGGGADYGRGPETDPVATAALVSVYSATNALNTRAAALATATNALAVRVLAAETATNALDVRMSAVEGYFGALGATSIVFASTIQTNTLYFNTQGVLTNHAQEGP